MAMAAFPGAGAANAMTEARTARGGAYVSGGIALEEREALDARAFYRHIRLWRPC
ncbi:MAG: hypothetical protein ACTS6J_09940 [Burkholderiales bacterium]